MHFAISHCLKPKSVYIVLNQSPNTKVSTSELAAVEQRLTTKLEAQIKNLTESVIVLQQENIIPDNYWAVNLNATNNILKPILSKICLDGKKSHKTQS